MPDKNPIIRSEVFTVDSTAPNEYGALIVVDTAGKEHKIGEKRAHLHPIFQPGAEVKVGYANFRGKDYIAEAQTGGHKPVAVTLPSGKAASGIAPQAIGMTTKEVGDMIRAGMIDCVFKADADELTEWYRCQILSNASIPPTSRQEAKAPPVVTATNETKPSTTFPTPVQVMKDINKLVVANIWTPELAKQTVIDLGGSGADALSMLKTLTVPALAALNKKVQEALTAHTNPEDIEWK